MEDGPHLHVSAKGRIARMIDAAREGIAAGVNADDEVEAQGTNLRAEGA